MIIMRNMVVKAAQWPIRAFTLLESLVTLAVVALLTLSLSGSVTGIFQQVETNLFYIRFEYLYRDSQRLAAAEGTNVELQLTKDKISNGRTSIYIPESIHLDKGRTIVFDAKGGNSSLSKIRFSSNKEVVTYQLNMAVENIKRRSLRGYILIESLVAMAVLVLVSGLILEQINTNRRLMAENLHQQEVLSVATMAVQTKQDQLTLNGITVTVKRSQQGITVYESGKEIIHVSKQ